MWPSRELNRGGAARQPSTRSRWSTWYRPGDPIVRIAPPAPPSVVEVHPVWLNGSLVAAADASVPVFDHGLTVGDGVFETMRTERGTPFAMTRHLARLRRSLDGLGFSLERSDEELRGAMQAVADEVVGATNSQAKIRLTVTAGAGPLGSGRDDGGQTVYVAGAPLDEWPPSGAAVTVPWRRNEHSAVAGLKTTSYAENVVALARAREMGATEALLANTAGDLCEGTGSNVFVVDDGAVRTPPLDSGCLAGVTRALVIEVAGAAGIDVSEEGIPVKALSHADEIFLTSSTRDVQGQHAVDDRRFDAPGPVTRRIADAFRDLATADVDP